MQRFEGNIVDLNLVRDCIFLFPLNLFRLTTHLILQGTVLDGHALILQLCHSKDDQVVKKADKDMNSTKLIVRNVAFEATVKDLRQLFGSFGQVICQLLSSLNQINLRLLTNYSSVNL